METPPATAQPALATTVGTRTAPDARENISADFDTFLTLLTTQLRSQDPLNPVDSTDFIAQLASFSAVEQQTRTNELLGNFLDAAATDSPASLVGLVGREVAAPVAVPFDGETPLGFTGTPPAGADSATMTVFNEFGSPVARMAVDPAASAHDWDGTQSFGGPAPAGLYSAEISYTVRGQPQTPVTLSGPTTVQEVRVEPEGPVLVLTGGARVAPDALTAIGEVPEADGA